MAAFLSALGFTQGYNVALVMLGAIMLGIAAGMVGSFLVLRQKALVSDAAAHATLPGIALAFVIMVGLGFDGRNLFVLLLGAGVSACMGILCITWLTRFTKLKQDSAIGAVLSVYFGFGVVLLTYIQSLSAGRQAGLEGFLLGSTAGMIFADGMVIAIGGSVCVLLAFIFHRSMLSVAFDAQFAQSTGISIGRTDLVIMGLATAITVVGLKIVGLVLIVALLIIPPVTARFWSHRASHVVFIAGVLGGLAGYLGTGLSASAPNLPTGPIIVLFSFALFAFSFLFAPKRGVVALWLAHRQFQHQVHLKQGLLALGRQEAIYDALTLKLMHKNALLRKDGVPTTLGRTEAAKALHDNARWALAQKYYGQTQHLGAYDGLAQLEERLTPDQLAHIEAQLNGLKRQSAD